MMTAHQKEKEKENPKLLKTCPFPNWVRQNWVSLAWLLVQVRYPFSQILRLIHNSLRFSPTLGILWQGPEPQDAHFCAAAASWTSGEIRPNGP
jgi:hypothetical protein